MAPPPVFQALVWTFQVSEPGSPGAGITKVFHWVSPVLGSSEAIQSRTPLSPPEAPTRSEEHTSELQSHLNLVCRLMLETQITTTIRTASVSRLLRLSAHVTST